MKGCVDLAPGESPAFTGPSAVQLAHDLGFEFLVVIEGERFVIRVVEEEGECELGRPAATISPFEARGTVIRQLETPLWRELLLLRLLLDDGMASTTVTDVDDVGISRGP